MLAWRCRAGMKRRSPFCWRATKSSRRRSCTPMIRVQLPCNESLNSTNPGKRQSDRRHGPRQRFDRESAGSERRPGSLQRFDSRIGPFGYDDPITMNTNPEIEDAAWRAEKLFLTPFHCLTPFLADTFSSFEYRSFVRVP